MKWLLILLALVLGACAHRVPTEVLLMQYTVEAAEGSTTGSTVKGELEARGFECSPEGCWKPDG